MLTNRALVVATLAMLGAGCGSAGPQASTGQSAGGPVAAAYRYADCMRSHGVSGFPGPRVSVSGDRISVMQALPASAAASPSFKTARRACAGIIPGPGSAAAPDEAGHKQALLAFARCMRARGWTSFPDPDRQGRITGAMLSAAGVDLRSRAFFWAAIVCAPVTHGLVTASQVRQAVSGQH